MTELSKRRQQISGWLLVAVLAVLAAAVGFFDVNINDVLNSAFGTS